MPDTKKPCTREEAAGILAQIAVAPDPAKPVALQKEARRTTYLTILIAVVAVLTFIVAGLEIYDEYFRPD